MRKTMRRYFIAMQIIDLLWALLLCSTPILLLIFSNVATKLTGLSIYTLMSCEIPVVILALLLFKASSKFKNAKISTDAKLVENKKSLMGWGVFSAIMLVPTILGFVVVLVFATMVNRTITDIENGDFERNYYSIKEKVKEKTKATTNESQETFGVKGEMQRQKEQLEELKAWKKSGILTDEEYKAKRKKILGLWKFIKIIKKTPKMEFFYVFFIFFCDFFDKFLSKINLITLLVQLFLCHPYTF